MVHGATTKLLGEIAGIGTQICVLWNSDAPLAAFVYFFYH